MVRGPPSDSTILTHKRRAMPNKSSPDFFICCLISYMYMYVSRQERIRTGGRSYAPVLMRSWSRLYCLKKIITLQSDDNSCVLMVVGNFVNANIHDQSLTNLNKPCIPQFLISQWYFLVSFLFIWLTCIPCQAPLSGKWHLDAEGYGYAVICHSLQWVSSYLPSPSLLIAPPSNALCSSSISKNHSKPSVQLLSPVGALCKHSWALFVSFCL